MGAPSPPEHGPAHPPPYCLPSARPLRPSRDSLGSFLKDESVLQRLHRMPSAFGKVVAATEMSWQKHSKFCEGQGMTQRASPVIRTKRASLNYPLTLFRKRPDRYCKDKASPSAKANPSPGCCSTVTWRQVTPLGSRGQVAPWDAAAASPCGTTASTSEGSKLASRSSSNSSKSLRRLRRWH